MVEFKNIPGYENYIASSNGKIFNTNYKRTGKTVEMSYYNSRGYYNVCLSKNGKGKTLPVHLLVMKAFYDYKPTNRSMVINHIDNNSLNNNLDNLEVVTNRYNSSCHQYLNKNRTSEFIGVYWHKLMSKWKASIWFKTKMVPLGYFELELDAGNEYLRALREIETTGNLTVSSPADKKKSSIYRGVSYSLEKRKWIAQIYWNKKQLNLGGFNTEEEAFNARCNFINNNKSCR